MQLKEKLKSLIKYAPVMAFLSLEVFALIAFSLGNSIILFGSLSLALAIILAIFTYNEINKDGLSKTIFLFFPLVIYVLLIALGTYTKAHVSINDISTGEMVLASLGILSVGAVGYLLSINKAFRPSQFLIIIYSGIALLVIINLIINLINFGAFHTILYKNYYMYYGGQRSSLTVDNIAYALEGFKFIEVKITHYTLYPILLLTSVIGLINISPKKEKYKFITYCVFVVVAVLALVLVPSLYGLIFGFIVLVIMLLSFLYKKFSLKFKPFKITILVFTAFAAVVLLIMILNTQDFSKGFAKAIASVPILNKIFNTNPFVSAYNANLTNVFCTNRFFGYCAHGNALFISDLAPLTDSILFDNFMTSGVIGVAALIVFYVLGFKKSGMIADESRISFRDKTIFLTFVATFIIYSLIAADGEYAIFHRVIRPTYLTAPFLISVFIISYLYCVGTTYEKEKEGKENEVRL